MKDSDRKKQLTDAADVVSVHKALVSSGCDVGAFFRILNRLECAELEVTRLCREAKRLQNEADCSVDVRAVQTK